MFGAHDESLGRDVALKLLNAEHKTSPDVVRRFLQEARLAARIGHPGIVTVYECAEIAMDGGDIAYIAMELLDGETLTSRLARAGRLPTPTAMELGRQIASALEAAHRGGIVHRDLKPDNVFLVKDPAVLHGERVKVLDFGIAKARWDEKSSGYTGTNEVFGTPLYMSPEQCRSSTHIDLRSDIYTLGCILFELLAGRPPFVGAPGELFANHLMVDAPSVRAFANETPPHVANLIAKMLAKEPDARPQSMAEVQRGLEAGGAVIVGPAATLPPNAGPQGSWAVTQPAERGNAGASGSIGGSIGGSIVDNNSTLKAAAGMSMMYEEPAPRGSRMLGIVGAAVVAVAIAVVFVVWLRSGNDELASKVPAPQANVAGKAPALKNDGAKSDASNTGAKSDASNAGMKSDASNAGAKFGLRLAVVRRCSTRASTIRSMPRRVSDAAAPSPHARASRRARRASRRQAAAS